MHNREVSQSRSRNILPALLGVFMVIGVPVGAVASDLLGTYVGAAVGRSTPGGDNSGPPPSQGLLSGNATGWHIEAGVRPISLVGGEVEYIDLGSRSASYSSGFANFKTIAARSSSHAFAAFALFYAPIPLPFLDLYLKGGVAVLDTKVSGSVTCDTCPGSPPPSSPFGQSTKSTRPAYGVGAQLKALGVALRLEYERVSSNVGDPDLLSLGVSWHF